MSKRRNYPALGVLLLVCTGCPGVGTGLISADKIPGGVYVGIATCTDSSESVTTQQAVLRVDEDGHPLTAGGERLTLGTPLELPAGGGFEFDGELTGLEVDGPKIVETWTYTATTTSIEGGEFLYVLTKTSRLESDGDITFRMTQVGSGFDPSLDQYVTWNQDCSGTLSP